MLNPIKGEIFSTGAGNLPYKHIIHIFGAKNLTSNKKTKKSKSWLELGFKRMFIKCNELKIKSLVIPDFSQSFSGFDLKKWVCDILNGSKKFIDF